MPPDADGMLNLTLLHDDEQARDRFNALDLPEQERDQAVLGGWQVAETRSVAPLMEGKYGLTDAEIELTISLATASDLQSLTEADIGESQRYAYSVGFKSRMRLAKACFLAHVQSIENATDAMEKVAEGFTAVSKALAAVHALTPAIPPAPAPSTHLLALSRRRLRPEDFGALPTPQR